MELPQNFRDKRLHASGVYSITCAPTGKVYVGSAVDMFTRWRGHHYHLSAGSHHCSHLQRAWRKYGPEAFTFAVVEFAGRDVLRTREQYHIDSVIPSLRLNSTPTAGSLLGFKMSAETIERLRIASTGRRHSEETKAQLSAARKGINPRPVGWKMTEEGKQKLRGPRKPLSPEHREKSIAILRGARQYSRTAVHRMKVFERCRKLTDAQVSSVREQYLAGDSMETIAKAMECSRRSVTRAIRGVGHYGGIGDAPVTIKIKRTTSEELKQRLSAATKGRPKSEQTKANMRAAWAKRRTPAAA